MKVIVAGCGRVGAQLAEMLFFDGHEVSVIDRDRASFERLSKAFGGHAVEGMAFDEETLLEAGIEGADAFAAVTNLDNTNLMSAEVAKRVFQVPRVVARLYNPDKEETFQALGIDYICGPEVMSQLIMEKLTRPAVRIHSPCCRNTLQVVEFTVPARWRGKRIGWAEENLGMKVAYVVRRGDALLSREELTLQQGDEVTALMPLRRISRLERLLRRHGRR